MNYKIKKARIYSSIISLVVISYTAFSLDNVIASNIENDHSSWMSDLSDKTKITDIALPGTHNSGALYSFFDVAGKCQDVDIANQLKMGVRYLDIRLQNNKNGFRVVHDFIDQKLDFQKVLNDCYTFLDNNPSEFIFMSIKEDKEGNSLLTFNSRLNLIIDKQKFYLEKTLPKEIKDVRGKIVLLSRYANPIFGINCHDGWKDDISESGNSFLLNNNEIYVQDYYQIREISFKKEEIINCLSHKDNNQLNLNFTSGYLVNSFPPASAYPVAKEINKWLIDDVLTHYDYRGVIISDFATSTFCEEIIGINFKDA